MSTATETKPKREAFEVGKTAVLVAGVEGTVEAVTDDTVTINGHTLPRRMNTDGGVRYLSTVWPETTTIVVDDEAHDDCVPAGEQFDTSLDQLRRAVESNHYEEHEGTFRFCRNSVCRLAYGEVINP